MSSSLSERSWEEEKGNLRAVADGSKVISFFFFHCWSKVTLEKKMEKWRVDWNCRKKWEEEEVMMAAVGVFLDPSFFFLFPWVG